jgi:signal transduction histidine kinase
MTTTAGSSPSSDIWTLPEQVARGYAPTVRPEPQFFQSIGRTASRMPGAVHNRLNARQIELRRLEIERRALLRLGALAGTAPIGELFAAIAEELARVVDMRTGETHEDMSALSRFNADASLTLVAAWGEALNYPSPIGSTWPLLDGDSANRRVYLTGRPARLEGGIPVTGAISDKLGSIKAKSSIAVPIFVDDKLWGSATIMSDRSEHLPPSTEARLADFAALASTAISSAQRREEIRRLADEQSAMRRVATLVAQQPQLSSVYECACAELLALLHLEDTMVLRFEADNRITVVGAASLTADSIPVGHTFEMDTSPEVDLVRDARKAARVDSYADAEVEVTEQIRRAGIRASLAQPIRLGNRLWGALAVASPQLGRITDRTYAPVADCAELIATAIRNSEAADNVRASRERIVAAGDQSRQRFERNLHDGAQQRLVSLALELRHDSRTKVSVNLAGVANELESILADLRELSHGLHPTVLSEAGLAGAVKLLARRCPVPVELTVPDDLPPLDMRTQVAGYYLMSEALANIVKHSRATSVSATFAIHDDDLIVEVSDDGVGGAALGAGSGLIGITDRVEALGGEFVVRSEQGSGTTLMARLPLQPSSQLLSEAGAPV